MTKKEFLKLIEDKRDCIITIDNIECTLEFLNETCITINRGKSPFDSHVFIVAEEPVVKNCINIWSEFAHQYLYGRINLLIVTFKSFIEKDNEIDARLAINEQLTFGRGLGKSGIGHLPDDEDELVRPW